MAKCVYPGSFNPVHLGHMHVILQASRIFGDVTVLVAVNPAKTYRVSAEDRRAILENLVGTLPCHNVSVDISDRPLMEYYDKMDMDAVIRGERNGTDLESERAQSQYNLLLRYCKKHGIAHEKVSVVQKPVRSAHYASQKERYDDVMRRLSMGRGIGAIDYRFLKRYCKSNGITMPVMEITIPARLKQ